MGMKLRGGLAALTAALLLAGCGSSQPTVDGMKDALQSAGFEQEAASTDSTSLALTLGMVCTDDGAAAQNGANVTPGSRMAKAQEVRIRYACPERVGAYLAAIK